MPLRQSKCWQLGLTGAFRPVDRNRNLAWIKQIYGGTLDAFRHLTPTPSNGGEIVTAFNGHNSCTRWAPRISKASTTACFSTSRFADQT